MKLTRDNYELVMFDLLEGNLTESDELNVMAQIEANEFFFKEWKLFKTTILVADSDVVYKNKESLLKDEPSVIPMFRWASVAAAACLIIGFIAFWPKDTPIDVADTPTEIISPIEQEEPTVPVVQAIETEEIETPAQVVRNDAEPELFIPESIDEDLDVADTNEEVIAIEAPNKESEIKEVPKLINEVQQEEQPKYIVENLEPKTLEDIYTAPATNPAEYQKDVPNFITVASEFVTSKPKERIMNKANEFIAKVSNPKVRFKPQFVDKKPGLQIEFETTGYQAIASLQPFNKSR